MFTLPAGVITDRNDRRLLMTRRQRRPLRAHGLRRRRRVRPPRTPCRRPTPSSRSSAPRPLLYLLLLGATLLLGVCEVLYDNSAQTFMPALVADEHLERANGRLYSAELVANQFVGPPLAGLLLAVGFALPFVVDAGTFAASAALVFSIAVSRTARAPPTPARGRSGGRRSPRGSAGSGTTPCCARWPSRSGALNLLEQRQLRRLRDLRPGGARHVDDGVRHPRRGARDRRGGRRLGGAGRHASRLGAGPVVAARRVGRRAGDARRRLRVVLAGRRPRCSPWRCSSPWSGT